MNEYLVTLLTAAAPVSELRGAIPLALGVYKMPVVTVFILAIIGNMLPVFFILYFLDPVQKWLSKNFKIFRRFFSWLFEHTKTRHAKKFEVYKELALITFVAIPLPMTGAYSGALAAYVLGLSYKKSLACIFAGVLIAAVVVTLACTGVIKFFLIN